MKAAASASNESHQSKANASDVAGQPPSQGIAFEPPEALLFEDKRPEAAAQRRLQALARNSPQVQRLKAIQDMANNSPHAKQAAQLQERANNHVVRTAQRSAQHAGGSQQAPVMQRSLQGPNVAAAFTSIPSGKIATKLKDWKILADFDMKAKFSPDNTPAGRWGEFRQYIRGYFRTTKTATGAVTDLVHPLIPGTTLHETNWQEDGDAGGGYGHRPGTGPGDAYTDKPDGSIYAGEDHPESDPVQSGESLHMHLEFKGELIETGGSTPDTILDTKYWHIDQKRNRS